MREHFARKTFNKGNTVTTYSMTAFARQQVQTDVGTFVWEIRSVNHRHLDVGLRLEEAFRPLEMGLRKAISQRVSRGKVDASLRYQPPESVQTSLAVDAALLNAVLEQASKLAAQSSQVGTIDPLDLLKWPGVLQTDTPDLALQKTSIQTTLDAALTELIATRATEGAALAGMITQRCEQITEIVVAAAERMPVVLAAYRQKLQERIAEMQATVEPERLEQELVLLAQKIDIAEELDRLNTHVTEVQQVLTRDEPVGRRLDFLMQELNREANTLASKSIDSEMTKMSVELKVLIEQMREQIQNIE